VGRIRHHQVLGRQLHAEEDQERNKSEETLRQLQAQDQEKDVQRQETILFPS